MKQMNIGFAINAIGGGGAERVITILCSQFAEKGYNTHLICNRRKDWEYPVSSLVKRHFVEVGISSVRPLGTFQRISKIRRICRKEKLDVLVAFMGMNECAVIATLGIKTKCIFSIRNAPEHLFRTRAEKIKSKLILPLASGAVFQTEAAKEWFPISLQRKSIVIFNPISSRFYGLERKIEKGLLIASGRLTDQKNYPLMLRAIALVCKKYEIRLEIYGKGENQEKIRLLSDELGLSDNVKLCGQSDDIPSVLCRAEIYLLASDYEGMPNALMEAMAVGVPCLATDSLGGGTRLLLGENERGVLVECGNVEKFAEGIEILLKGKEIRDVYSQRAKAYAQNFSIDNCFKNWEGYICSFLED